MGLLTTWLWERLGFSAEKAEPVEAELIWLSCTNRYQRHRFSGAAECTRCGVPNPRLRKKA